MTTAYGDLPAAAIGWLRAQPSIVAAFGDDTSSPATKKFWADEAESSPSLPWAVYMEDPGPQTYMTGDLGSTPYIDEGIVRFFVVAASRKQARTLGGMIATALTDPPLQFAGGLLMYMRPSNQFFTPTGDIAPDSPSAYVRVVVFNTMVQRSL